MNQFKAAVLFILKSFAFSVIFICTAFILYVLSPYNTPRQKASDKTYDKYMEEYNRQISESSKRLDSQKELLKKAEENMKEEEKNAKRMSAILDQWERQAKRGK